MKKQLGLVIRPGIGRAVQLGREVIDWAKTHNYEVLLEENVTEHLTADIEANYKKIPAKEMANCCDPIVVLGGDGTLIGVAHFIKTRWPVMIGVNFGHLGFLTEIAPDDLLGVLDEFNNQKVLISERRMVSASVFRDGEEVFSGQAVNEAAILKSVEDPLLDLDLFFDDEEMLSLRADGLLIATTTGSTAYSLAAGGSIVHPEVPALLVTPVMPHVLAIRPLVLPLDSEIKAVVLDYDGQVILSLDGQLHFQLKPGDQIKVKKAPTSVRFIRSSRKTYFEILRSKLSWGSFGVVNTSQNKVA